MKQYVNPSNNYVADSVQVYADATITFPMIVAATFAKQDQSDKTEFTLE